MTTGITFLTWKFTFSEFQDKHLILSRRYGIVCINESIYMYTIGPMQEEGEECGGSGGWGMGGRGDGMGPFTPYQERKFCLIYPHHPCPWNA